MTVLYKPFRLIVSRFIPRLTLEKSRKLNVHVHINNLSTLYIMGRKRFEVTDVLGRKHRTSTVLVLKGLVGNLLNLE